MKPSLPYVPWYHGDFIRSTQAQGWNLMEQAIYWKLLCAQWEAGALPEDVSRLAAIVGIDVAEMAKLWPLIGKKFTRTDSGYVNERMEEHRRHYIEWRQKQSDGGKKGSGIRWKKPPAPPSTVVPFQGRKGDHE